MYKGIATVFTLVLMSATSASAFSAADIQTQIKELLTKIEALQQEVKRTTTSSAGSSVSGAVFADNDSDSFHARPFCKRGWSRALSQGAQGEDVRDLQNLLKEEGLFNAEVSGFYGKVTQDAVRSLQADNNIGSTGTVGPRTRLFLKNWCSGERALLSASPQSGVAPLSVQFKTNVKLANDSFVADAGYYKIVFGDGGEEKFTCTGANPWCDGVKTVNHVYQLPGEYTATLVHYGYYGISGDNERVVARRNISVGRVGTCTKEYAPVCGSYQVQCITTPCYPIEQTYSNKCTMTQAGATYLYSGECKVSGNKAPIIEEFSAPTTLQVNEVGTWKVSARDPENGSLSYRIDWGDLVIPDRLSAALGLETSEQLFVQSTSFTHSYERSGTYTITLYVRDSAGAVAKASATVRVGDTPVSCTLEYRPVCGQPKWSCASGLDCVAAMAQPKTYGNRCQLNSENATFLYEGACTTDNRSTCAADALQCSCPADARQCSDGSWVGRTGSNCQFVCPSTGSGGSNSGLFSSPAFALV